MSMSVNLHTNGYDRTLKVSGTIRDNGITPEPYMVLDLTSKDGTSTHDVTIFASFDQIKAMKEEIDTLVAQIYGYEKQGTAAEEAIADMEAKEKILGAYRESEDDIALESLENGEDFLD